MAAPVSPRIRELGPRLAEQADYDFKILRSVMEVNALQRERFVDKILNRLEEPERKEVAVLGLTFKPNTDDLRDAPSIDIIGRLTDRGRRVRAYDPVAGVKAAALLPAEGVTVYDDPYEAIDGADAMVIVTEWPCIRELDLNRVKGLLKEPLMIDGRNCFPPERMHELGFRYESVGRPRASTAKGRVLNA
ncbi:hypothetical protein LJK88_21410 [Paenibacillus sp. P26]|nr:hypothetical protein LJK88_21410 [Paenibacillus sp. P26]